MGTRLVVAVGRRLGKWRSPVALMGTRLVVAVGRRLGKWRSPVALMGTRLVVAVGRRLGKCNDWTQTTGNLGNDHQHRIQFGSGHSSPETLLSASLVRANQASTLQPDYRRTPTRVRAREADYWRTTDASGASGAQNFIDLVSNTNTHAARTRTGAHGGPPHAYARAKPITGAPLTPLAPPVPRILLTWSATPIRTRRAHARARTVDPHTRTRARSLLLAHH
jgi:hypothetical protein